MRATVSPRRRGFTLIEMAIALAIMALLSAGAIALLQSAQLRARIARTQDALEQAREALDAYAVIHRSLPCPAASPLDGYEQSRAGGQCASRRGLLPWSTLGVQGLDGWDNRLGYVVSPGLVKRPGERIQLSSQGDVRIVQRDGQGSEIDVVTASAVAYGIWSHGANGRGATTHLGTLRADDGSDNIDEKGNSSQAGSDPVLRAREEGAAGSAGGEYDDIVLWESRYILFGRMMQAGQLP
ncbi:type II secretion system protein [Methyloversatilis thermotolerans]|uniref:type II secretion system protein n=1 Tax=Methyloversatilis thermotolerans TaxID=1346290 RepID=UPI00036CB5AE|nr:type II secretion system protein [Methyloversatilis thermotolerans]